MSKCEHRWYISDGLFWDKATCVDCGRVIRSYMILEGDLPE